MIRIHVGLEMPKQGWTAHDPFGVREFLRDTVIFGQLPHEICGPNLTDPAPEAVTHWVNLMCREYGRTNLLRPLSSDEPLVTVHLGTAITHTSPPEGVVNIWTTLRQIKRLKRGIRYTLLTGDVILVPHTDPFNSGNFAGMVKRIHEMART